jgi:hypothetical protein
VLRVLLDLRDILVFKVLPDNKVLLVLVRLVLRDSQVYKDQLGHLMVHKVPLDSKGQLVILTVLKV